MYTDGNKICLNSEPPNRYKIEPINTCIHEKTRRKWKEFGVTDKRIGRRNDKYELK